MWTCMRIVVGWAAIAFQLVLKAQNPVSLTDNSFPADKWVSRKIVDTGGDGSFTAQTATAGGNPGAYRDVTITFKSGSVSVSHLRLNGPELSYSPQQQGAITAVSYSYDLKAIQPGSATKHQLAIYQSGSTYACQQIDVASLNSWFTFQPIVPCFPSSFAKLDGPGPDHPDFSAAAPIMYFGYITSTPAGQGNCDTYGYCMAADLQTWETGLANLVIKISTLVVAPTGPACAIKPQNMFLAAHRPIRHLSDPQHPVHVLTVTATSNGAPMKGAKVTLGASRLVFTGSPAQPPTLNSLTSITDDNGRAAFGINPPDATGFDRTDLVANVTSGSQTVSCKASVIVGLGTMTVPLNHFMDAQAKTAVVNHIQGRLLALRRDLLQYPSDIERLQAKMRAHRTTLRKILEARFSDLSERDLDVLVRLASYADKSHLGLRRTLFGLKQDLAEARAVAAQQNVPVPKSSPPPLSRRPDHRQPEAGGALRANIEAKYGRLPLSFEPNRGQMNSRVRFLARTGRYNFYFTSKELVISNASPSGWSSRDQAVRMELAGASGSPRIAGIEEQPGKSNYLFGGDRSRWCANVPHFAQVKYERVYPGIDMLVHGRERSIQFDFLVAPGADPATIALGFRGVERPEVDPAGGLVLRHSSGLLRLEKPFLYQEINGERRAVDGGYAIRPGDEVGFQIASYDPKLPLVIDPVVSYATYVGGSGDDTAMGIAVDAQGNAYITGGTASPDFPVASAMQSVLAGNSPKNVDAFVIKLDPTGSHILYSTYIGGSGGDIGMGIAVDASGSAYVTGATTSADFPLVHSIQGAYRGGSTNFPGDAFVFKLNPSGSGLAYSTYWGGSGGDVGRAIAVDSSGNAYVTGFTNSTDMPIRNALQAVNRSGFETFVVKLNSVGTDFAYATYLGGSAGDDVANAIAVDPSGSVYLTGATFSSDFPTHAPLQAKKGEADAFVLKLNPSGSGLVYSTFLGGAHSDVGLGIAVDANGNAYVTGMTASPDFPLANAAQVKFGASDVVGAHAFISKLDATGSKLLYSTFLGGKGTDVGLAIAVGSDGSAYVAGETDSPDFPLAGASQGVSGANNGFVVKLNPAGSAFTYTTLLGGSSQNTVTGIALDASANVYIAGSTTSGDLPVTYGALGATAAGQTDAMVVKLVEGTPVPRIVSLSAASLQSIAARGSIVSAFGTGLAARTEAASAVPLPTTLAGSVVKIKDSAGKETPAPLFFASPSQINCLVPQDAAAGLAAVTVLSGNQTIATGTLRIEDVAPGLFTANASGQGVAAALALLVAQDQTQTSLSVFQCGSSPGTCVATPLDLGADTDRVFLLLFGTGIQNRRSLATVSATMGGVDVPLLYAGPQGDAIGLDQVNIGPVPASLRGRGETSIVLTVDGKTSNVVTVSIK